MAGEDAAVVSGETLSLVCDVIQLSAAGFAGYFKKDCTDLSRRVALLAHFIEEVMDLRNLDTQASSSPTSTWFSDLKMIIQAAKRLLSAADNFDSKISDVPAKKITFQFQSLTWRLGNVLRNLPCDQFDISEDVQEQVELIRTQLKRATERYGGSLSSIVLSRTLRVENIGNIDDEVKVKGAAVPKGNGVRAHIAASSKMRRRNIVDVFGELHTTNNSLKEDKKADSTFIPDDFLCPISLEIMRDPVIVATGQTYERSYIQRWIDCGNKTCPKTQQKLQNLTLTPNYALRSLVTQWCANNNVQQSATLKIKKRDGTFRDVSGDITAIEALVCKLSSQSIEERRAAVAEIRSLSKRSTDNRILIAEARAIPLLVDLLTTEDGLIQENAVTSILNLSIYENNKGLIMLANAIPPVVVVLTTGTMEARENAAATIFSLSLAEENKIIIGASGAIPALVELLKSGSTRGKKDAATALFNLCAYQGNKGRAVKAGIITALLEMLVDSSNCLVDEALTILSVLANHQEAKVAIVKTNTIIPVLIDLLSTGLPRNKENAAAILLSLCKRETENLGCISRLGVVEPLIEIVKSGTERAKRKATLLLEHIRKLQQS